MISKNIAKLYLQSERGKTATEMFTVVDDMDLMSQRLEALYDLCEDNILRGGTPSLFLSITDATRWSIGDTLSTYDLWNAESSSDLFNQLICNFQLYDFNENGDALDKNKILIKKGYLREIITLIPYISLSLYTLFPEDDTDIFYPILFNHNFQTFKKWCMILGIDIPEIPLQKDKIERCVFNVGKNTITMELLDLGDGYEHEEGITIRLPEFKKATGLESEEDIYAFIRENFGVNNGMSKMRGFLIKNKITYNSAIYCN